MSDPWGSSWFMSPAPVEAKNKTEKMCSIAEHLIGNAKSLANDEYEGIAQDQLRALVKMIQQFLALAELEKNKLTKKSKRKK